MPMPIFAYLVSTVPLPSSNESLNYNSNANVKQYPYNNANANSNLPQQNSEQPQQQQHHQKQQKKGMQPLNQMELQMDYWDASQVSAAWFSNNWRLKMNVKGLFVCYLRVWF